MTRTKTKTKRAARPPTKYLSTTEVSKMLQIPVKTIYDWRLRGEGPPSVRIGRHLRFPDEALYRWLDALGDE